MVKDWNIKAKCPMKITFDIPDSAVAAQFSYMIYKKGVLKIETILIHENELDDGITIRHEISYDDKKQIESLYEYRGRKV